MKWKRNSTEKRVNIWKIQFLFLLVFSLLLSGCSYHDSRFSYFDMLDPEKRTLQNKKSAEKFWSSVRPVSTLSMSHYKLGRYYQQQGKYDKAIVEFSKALRNDGRYCKAYNGIAMSYDALKRCEMAHNLYEQALQCDPQKAYLYNNYAYSSILCGDYEKGRALLLKAAQLSADNSRIKNNLKLTQMIIERENNSAQHVVKVEPAVPVAKTKLEPAENENEKSLTDPIYELPGNSTPGEPLNVVGLDRVPVGSAEKSLVNVNEFVDRLPMMEKVTEKTENLPTADVNISNKDTVSEFDSPLGDTIAIDSLVAKKTKKLIVRTHKSPSLNYSNGAVEVSNGNGLTGMAGKSADYFRGYGFNIRRITNAKHFRFNDSVIFYREGYLQVAKELAKVIPGAHDMEKVDSLGRSSIGVRVLLGKDLVNMQFPQGYAPNVVDDSSLDKKQLVVQQITIANLSIVN